jgi:hypothetical protein
MKILKDIAMQPPSTLLPFVMSTQGPWVNNAPVVSEPVVFFYNFFQKLFT